MVSKLGVVVGLLIGLIIGASVAVALVQPRTILTTQVGTTPITLTGTIISTTTTLTATTTTTLAAATETTTTTVGFPGYVDLRFAWGNVPKFAREDVSPTYAMFAQCTSTSLGSLPYGSVPLQEQGTAPLNVTYLAVFVNNNWHQVQVLPNVRYGSCYLPPGGAVWEHIDFRINSTTPAVGDTYILDVGVSSGQHLVYRGAFT